MKYKRVPAGVYAANCYIVMDDETRESAVIDPGGDVDDIEKAIKSMGDEVKYILLTHGHMDHTGGVEELKKLFPALVGINEKDEEMIKQKTYIYGSLPEGKADINLKEGTILKIGNTEIKVIETPGHTPGGVSFLIDNGVFTGDTLFASSIGRTDFPGGNHETLIKSIKEKLMTLPEETLVLPGHMGESTIGREKMYNPFL